MKLKIIQNNLYKVTLGEIEIYFSYETPIALITRNIQIISENIWSNTTARHIAKVKRDNGVLFEVNNEEFLDWMKKTFN